MATVSLPLDPTAGPNYRVSTVLAGVQYVLDVRWNGRAEAWFLDVLNEEGDAIRRGIKIVLGTLLGGRAVAPDFPLGVFQAVDLTDSGTEAGLDDLGTRVQVYFYPFEDMA